MRWPATPRRAPQPPQWPAQLWHLRPVSTSWVDRLGQSNLRLICWFTSPLNGQMFLGVVLSTLTLAVTAGC